MQRMKVDSCRNAPARSKIGQGGGGVRVGVSTRDKPTYRTLTLKSEWMTTITPLKAALTEQISRGKSVPIIWQYRKVCQLQRSSKEVALFICRNKKTYWTVRTDRNKMTTVNSFFTFNMVDPHKTSRAYKAKNCHLEVGTDERTSSFAIGNW